MLNEEDVDENMFIFPKDGENGENEPVIEAKDMNDELNSTADMLAPFI